MKHSMAPVPGDFLNSRASGSVVEAWVAFDRRSPRKSTSALRLRRVGRVIGLGSAVDWSGEDVGGALVSGGSPGSSRECQVFCVWVIGSMLPERSKDDDDFQRTAG